MNVAFNKVIVSGLVEGKIVILKPQLKHISDLPFVCLFVIACCLQGSLSVIFLIFSLA